MKPVVKVSFGLLMFLSSITLAGGQSGGGGSGKQCGRDVELADIIDSSSPIPSYFNFLSMTETRDGLTKFIEAHLPVNEVQEIKDAFLKIKFVPTTEKLPKLDTGYKI